VSSLPLTDWLDAAQEAARRGAAVLEDWRQRFSVREKARFDLVTEADVGSQQAIWDYLHQQFPDHAFVGEEELPASRVALAPQASAKVSTQTITTIGPDAPPTWIVDPLDGTTNYVHDCPVYCVSIGLLVRGELVVGVVYDPSRQEMFQAAIGQGAWLSRAVTEDRAQRLQTSRSERLEESLLATGFPPDVRGQERALDWWRYFSLRTRSLRRTGSTALNLAYVAAGRFDAYWGFDNHAWDVAAAAVLIREAGGTLTTTTGRPFDPFIPDTLASNGPLHPVLLEAFRQGL
jgi:myo-inositol-1(or 4)-monophosphatase